MSLMEHIKQKKAEGLEQFRKAWVVSADMGYGHQRTAYPLKDIAFGGKIINSNNYDGIPAKDRSFWKQTRALYEFISRFKRIPFLGEFIFSIMDKFQKILSYYPKRDLSHPVSNLKNTFWLIKLGWGRDLIERFKKNVLPIIASFFVPAFMAEEFGYPGPIYCIICDADFNRSWVSLHPQKSKIKYFAPCTWARDRLKLYGVKEKNIFLTGYPLPKENIGSEKMEILKEDLKNRLVNLDPQKKYRKMYDPLINKVLGKLPEKSNHPLTIMFSIGGAGAQKEICVKAINRMEEKIKKNKLRFIISVGTHTHLKKYFSDNIEHLKINGHVRMLYGNTTEEYFREFNKALRETDILWTKPSELSFYAGLGIPIIIAPPIGSQEDYNKKWLLHIGAGVAQENLRYIDQWIYDLLDGGDFAEMAMEGFMEIEKMGAYNIEKIISEI
jgi:UDP-N-acetylglucosamine:LPS N-acetylglucosamine transferase